MQHQRAVVLVPVLQLPILVLGIGSLGLLRALGPTVQAHELLHVLRGAVQADVHEIDLVLRSGDAGQRPELGVAELAPGRGRGEQRQSLQRPGDAHLLPRGVGVDAAGPAQPVGTGQRPLVSPHAPAVELGDEGEEAPGRRVDVGGEGGHRSGEFVVAQVGEVVRSAWV